MITGIKYLFGLSPVQLAGILVAGLTGLLFFMPSAGILDFSGGGIFFGREVPVDVRRVAAADEKIDLNTAGFVSLQRIRGVGPSKAAAIVEYRRATGSNAFAAPEDLLKVKNIGPYILQQTLPHLANNANFGDKAANEGDYGD